MEGLIPFIYRAVVGNRSQERYKRCLSGTELSTQIFSYNKSYVRVNGDSGRLDPVGFEAQGKQFPSKRFVHRRSISCFSFAENERKLEKQLSVS